MYHTFARGGADGEQNGIFARIASFATMRAKISVWTHHAVNHMVGGLQIFV